MTSFIYSVLCLAVGLFLVVCSFIADTMQMQIKIVQPSLEFKYDRRSRDESLSGGAFVSETIILTTLLLR